MRPPLHWHGGAGQGDAYLHTPPRSPRGPRTWVCRAVVLATLASMLYPHPCHCLGDEHYQHDDDDGSRTGDDSATGEIQKTRERQAALEQEVRELRERLEAKEVCATLIPAVLLPMDAAAPLPTTNTQNQP